jgi:hypothetical protein
MGRRSEESAFVVGAGSGGCAWDGGARARGVAAVQGVVAAVQGGVAAVHEAVAAVHEAVAAVHEAVAAVHEAVASAQWTGGLRV